VWIGTKDIFVSLLITLIFIVFVDFLFNENSSFYCLPESFNTRSNSGGDVGSAANPLTQGDINTIKNILKKIEDKDNKK
jgi:hypothetical protein